MEAINIELNREGLIKFREAGKEKKKGKSWVFQEAGNVLRKSQRNECAGGPL